MPAANRRTTIVQQDGGHTHHWMIETQDGPASAAVCRTCGDKRDFDNAFSRTAAWRVRGASPTPPPADTQQ